MYAGLKGFITAIPTIFTSIFVASAGFQPKHLHEPKTFFIPISFPFTTYFYSSENTFFAPLFIPPFREPLVTVPAPIQKGKYVRWTFDKTFQCTNEFTSHSLSSTLIYVTYPYNYFVFNLSEYDI